MSQQERQKNFFPFPSRVPVSTGNFAFPTGFLSANGQQKPVETAFYARLIKQELKIFASSREGLKSQTPNFSEPFCALSQSLLSIHAHFPAKVCIVKVYLINLRPPGHKAQEPDEAAFVLFKGLGNRREYGFA